MDRDSLDYVVLSTQRLRHLHTEDIPVTRTRPTLYLGIKKSDEREGSEGFRYEDIRDLAKLGEVLLEVVGGHVLGASPHEDFAGDLLDRSLLTVGNLDVTPPTV